MSRPSWNMPKIIPNVAYAQDNLFTCSQDAQAQMVEKIKEHNLNRVVVAACSPSTHAPIFQDMLRSAGLNKYLFEMANIRNQCTWVHQNEPDKATEKCKDLVNMAVAKARLLQPLDYITVGVNQRALVIGGGVAGMTSALALADQGYEVHLVERKDRLGGNALKLHTTWRGGLVKPRLDALIREGDRPRPDHHPLQRHGGRGVRGGGQLHLDPVHRRRRSTTASWSSPSAPSRCGPKASTSTNRTPTSCCPWTWTGRSSRRANA